MKFKKIKNIKNNFTCFGCSDNFYYSPDYRSKNIYCEFCQTKKSFFGKIVEKVLDTITKK